MFKALGLASAFYLVQSRNVSNNEEKVNTSRNAICILFPHQNSGVQGLVSFAQESYGKKTKIVATVRGLKPNSLHGIHIHEFGDLTQGCTSAGAHYNPFNKRHGGILDVERHVGDMGNIKTDEKGNGYLAYEDNQIELFGENSIVGRSVVVHQDQDDLGRGGHADSATTGHSGTRVACGVIGLAASFKNIQPYA